MASAAICLVFTASAEGLESWLELSDSSIPRIENAPTTFLHYESEDLRLALGDGWREEHNNGLVVHSGCLWSGSIVSDLTLTVGKPRDRVLALTLRPHFVDKEHPQRVDVLWNGTEIGACQFAPEAGWSITRFDMAVPAALQHTGANKLTFLSRYALSARDVGRGGDKADARRVSFGIVALQLLMPGELPVDATSQDELPRQARTVAVLDDGKIAQQPDTRLTIPFSVPDANRCVLRYAKEGSDAKGATVSLRWDSLGGVQHQVLGFDEVQDDSRTYLETDLTHLAGQFAELVFDTTGCTDSERAIWNDPAIWIDQPNPSKPGRGSPGGLAPASKVVVVVLDALRVSGLGFGGAMRSVSPFIDTVAQNGIVYERAYSTASWTYPSIVSIFSGLYPFAHGVGAIDDRVADALPLLADILKDSGCATGCIAENPFFDERYRLSRGFDTYEYIFPGHARGENRTSGEVTSRALEFLGAHADDPLFLYVHYFPPHAPYATGNPYNQTMTYDPIESIDPADTVMHETEIGRRPKTAESVKQLQARYDENVRYVDDQVKALFAGMKELGLDQDTVVIITADHGEEFNEHGHLGHSDPPYNTLVKVPFIVHYGPDPSLHHKGERRSGVVSTVDLFPTVCGWLDAPTPAALVGRDLRQPNPVHRQGPLNFAQCQSAPPFEAYLWERYVLIRNSAGVRHEVYDTILDPLQQRDLAILRPVLADYLLAHSLAWRNGLDVSVAEAGPKATIDEDKSEELRSLGYL
ncbi:MAG: sulfatase-like hydrolase/transferase [Nitrospiraceae bacterium]|nr:sulfatase-like hydrolase/transferase [Nitrospiraceae bacterium]